MKQLSQAVERAYLGARYQCILLSFHTHARESRAKDGNLSTTSAGASVGSEVLNDGSVRDLHRLGGLDTEPAEQQSARQPARLLAHDSLHCFHSNQNQMSLSLKTDEVPTGMH